MSSHSSSVHINGVLVRRHSDRFRWHMGMFLMVLRSLVSVNESVCFVCAGGVLFLIVLVAIMIG